MKKENELASYLIHLGEEVLKVLFGPKDTRIGIFPHGLYLD